MTRHVWKRAGALAWRRLRPYVLAFAVLTVAGPAQAAGPGDTELFHGFAALPDAHLDTLRGGFVTADGLEINIGIERLVYINDTLQSQFVMDLSQLDRSAMQANAAVENYLQLIQSGAGNTLSSDVQALITSGTLQVIQNALDGQKIGHITGLDIEVSNYKNILNTDLGRTIDFEVTRSVGSIH